MEDIIVSGDRYLSIEEFHKRSARAASGLDKMGIGDGDSVALMLRNDFPFLECSFATNLVGAYSVPINWHYKKRETSYILQNSDAKLLVIHQDLLDHIPDDLISDIRILVVPTPDEIKSNYPLSEVDCKNMGDYSDWETWRDTYSEWENPPLLNRGSMIYTSGTTGNPKGVRRFPASSQLQTSMLDRLKDGLALKSEARVLMTGPMYHSAPNAYARATISLGGSLILMPKFNAEECLQMIEKHRISHMHMVPTMFNRILQLPPHKRQKYDFSSLESVVHGAAPCPPQIKTSMINWWGPIIHEYYGSTEAGLITTISSGEWLEEKGSVGKPLPKTKIHILDDNQETVETGTVGDIYVNLPVSPGFTYHKDENKRNAIEVRGLITNGDRGHLNERGYLYLSDRRADMVISGGVNIYPAEIEAVLITMPGIRDCAIFGIADPEYGEKLVAAIELRQDIIMDANKVRAFLGEQLAGFKVPKLVQFVDSLPREDSGKIFKKALRESF